MTRNNVIYSSRVIETEDNIADNETLMSYDLPKVHDDLPEDNIDADKTRPMITENQKACTLDNCVALRLLYAACLLIVYLIYIIINKK
jgi:hypothetical protein